MQNMQVRDATLTCSTCGQPFTYTASEQLAFARKGQHQPDKCAFCRAAQMITDGGPSRPAGDRSERQMYPAVCKDCGRQTMVPFEPRGGRPVYCSRCYQNHTTSTAGQYGSSARSRR